MKNRLLFCGMFVIAMAASSWAAGKKPAQDARPSHASPQQPSEAAKIWVVRPDGAQSCGIKEGMAPEQVSEELKNAGIQVFETRKGNDGKMHVMVCGAPTGSLNGFQILASDLPKALVLGFKEAPKNFAPN